MTPRHSHQFAIVLLAASVMLEIALLAGVFSLPDAIYHSLHLAFMAMLIGSQLALYLTADAQLRSRRYALWFAVGAAFTMVGDYINGTLSSVQPVSLKLTWAMLLFGIGYGLYILALWQHGRTQFANAPASKVVLLGMALQNLIVNVLLWTWFVEANLQGHDLLYYGSFVFNATLYVLMPLLAFRFYQVSQYSTGALIVLIGSVLIPYSDLVLFNSWLKAGDPPVATFELYALNWVVYFGGQVLISRFPALALEADASRSGSVSSRP